MAARRILFDGGGPLSALVVDPVDTPARATILALHGAGMSAGYFDGQTAPEISFCSVAAARGYRVVALDRPGYGESAAAFPLGQPLADQVRTVRWVLRDIEERFGSGVLLLGHSFGGNVALAVAAEESELLGVDVSGCGRRFRERAGGELDGSVPTMRRNWGPLRLYPPGTFRDSGPIVGPVPAMELQETARWPVVFAELAGRIQVPVRLTFAEHETWWRHDWATLGELRALLTRSPVVRIDRQLDAGHNISLGYSAQGYHLRVLSFFRACLDQRALSTT